MAFVGKWKCPHGGSWCTRQDCYREQACQLEAGDSEYWVLVDPANDIWKQVTEEEAKDYPVVEVRLRYAITASAIDEHLYGTKKK